VFSGCIPVAASGDKRETNDWYRQLKEFRKSNSKEAAHSPRFGRRPAEHFTGTVRIEPVFEAKDPACALGASAYLTCPSFRRLKQMAAPENCARSGLQLRGVEPLFR
jgi:hypothetical protein